MSHRSRQNGVARKRQVLFADEPTGSLDEVTGGKIIDLMFDFQRRQQTTLVLVTHDPKLASRCERQLVMQGGRLVSSAFGHADVEAS